MADREEVGQDCGQLFLSAPAPAPCHKMNIIWVCSGLPSLSSLLLTFLWK